MVVKWYTVVDYFSSLNSKGTFIFRAIFSTLPPNYFYTLYTHKFTYWQSRKMFKMRKGSFFMPRLTFVISGWCYTVPSLQLWWKRLWSAQGWSNWLVGIKKTQWIALKDTHFYAFVVFSPDKRRYTAFSKLACS